MNVAGEKMDIESIAQAVDVFAEHYDIQRHEFCVYPDISDLPGRYDVLLEVQERELSISQTFEAYKESLQAKGVETGQFKPIRLLDTQERVDFFFGRVINIE